MNNLSKNKLCKAAFAAGCFWGVEDSFMKLKGVTKTRVGYMGGKTENPSYVEVSTGKTGHAETVEIEYDPKIISYEKLLSYFFQIHDPTTPNRQGADIGSQYRSIIFYYDLGQKRIAEKYISELNKSEKFPTPIVTEIVSAKEFSLAEEYHQKYYMKGRNKE